MAFILWRFGLLLLFRSVWLFESRYLDSNREQNTRYCNQQYCVSAKVEEDVLSVFSKLCWKSPVIIMNKVGYNFWGSLLSHFITYWSVGSIFIFCWSLCGELLASNLDNKINMYWPFSIIELYNNLITQHAALVLSLTLITQISKKLFNNHTQAPVALF